MKESNKILALAFIISILVGVFTPQSLAQIDPKTVAGMWLFDDDRGTGHGHASWRARGIRADHGQ